MRREYIPSTELMELLRDTGRKRLAVPGLQEAVIGGLAYLYDSQVRDGSSNSASYHDFLPSLEMAGNKLMRLASGLRSFLGRHIVREHHLKGSWPAYIHFVADPKKLHAHPLLIVTDYNLFTTASTAHSLLFFDDRRLDEHSRIISQILKNADHAISGFKRGEAYNFWLTRHDTEKDLIYSGPLNIPISLVGFRLNLIDRLGVFGLANFIRKDFLLDWVRDCFNKSLNPSGGSAVFNVPNDADNTSMAVGFKVLYNRWQGNDPRLADSGPLLLLQHFRDLDRAKGDVNNEKSGKDTGAFLTWLKDENLPVFASPENGIIPLDVNNFDIVINANVLFSLSLAHMQSSPGYKDAVNLLSQTIENDAWHDASVYYPQKYIYPYAISRAWRDAGIREPLLDYSVSQLMFRILDEVTRAENQSVRHPGAFPVNKYHNYHQSTALGLITLLNLGRKMAENSGLSVQYDEVVEKAVKFLVSGRNMIKARQDETGHQFNNISPCYWESGVLYSSSLKQMAHWRSNAQTTSLVLEALAKYILAYDLADDGLLSRRLYLEKNGQKWLLSLNPVE